MYSLWKYSFYRFFKILSFNNLLLDIHLYLKKGFIYVGYVIWTVYFPSLYLISKQRVKKCCLFILQATGLFRGVKMEIGKRLRPRSWQWKHHPQILYIKMLCFFVHTPQLHFFLYIYIYIRTTIIAIFRVKKVVTLSYCYH